MLQELSKFSPLRVVDQERGRVLEPGQLGVVLAPPGTGKTGVLVQIALDHLIHGRRVAHVTVDLSVDRVRDWYDEGLKDLADVWAALPFTIENRIDMERRRHIFSYQRLPFTAEHFDKQLDLMATHQDFRPDFLVVDGFDLASRSRAELAALKAMAGERRASVWLASPVVAGKGLEPGKLPSPADAVSDLIDVAFFIDVDDHQASLHVLRGPAGRTGQSAALDPKTMLLRA